jgi:hypothetical protein
MASQVGKSSEVLGRREPLRLEAPHLTRRGRAPLRRLAADNPAHSRIVAQALGVVHILVSGKATKYRLNPANACVDARGASSITTSVLNNVEYEM